MASSTRKIVLEVTQDQLDMLEGFYTACGMDFQPCVLSASSSDAQEEDGNAGSVATQDTCSGTSDEHDEENNEDEDSDGEEGDRCIFCYLNPCCTQYNHDFVGKGQSPCDDNKGIRNNRYKKYWQVISNLGGWNKPQYKRRKERLGRDAGVGVWHKREVMPDCVLNQLRGLYPNPPGQPYMGHKWV